MVATLNYIAQARYNLLMTEGWGEVLLDWFSKHQRDLPWRRSRDPYAIWISEVMLQQTRVETVLPYFRRWMEQFPDVVALANATIDQVLKAWEGLGYYRRAHQLHKTAGILVHEHNAELPQTEEELQRLPGIGSYTGAAIAAIAYDQQVIALDGNLRRVLSRLAAYDLDPRSKEGKATLLEHARDGLPMGQAGEFNQALMDLGATICVPRSPKCEDCPLTSFCLAWRQDIQDQLPARKARSPIPHHQVTAAVILRGGKVLVGRRPEGKLLGGLWEFPGGKVTPGEELEIGLNRELQEELGIQVAVQEKIGVYEHAYTHFSVTLHAFWCRLRKGAEPRALEHIELRWEVPSELSGLPMGKLDRQIADALLQAGM